jgi:hypothetical protein
LQPEEKAMDHLPSQGIELADAIGLLRRELLKARHAGAGHDVQFPIDSMTVELKLAATRSTDGKAGFSVPIVNLEVGGSTGWQRESMQTVTVVFGPPVDLNGNPVKVAKPSNEIKG